jgi:hypothetical protein
MAVSGRKLDYPSKITDSRKVIRSRKSKMDKQTKRYNQHKRSSRSRVFLLVLQLTDRHDMAEILLKVAVTTIALTLF